MSNYFNLILKSYLEYKKEKILSDVNSFKNCNFNNNSSVMKIAEALVEDGGSATK
jgi:hypothetical protein